MAIAKNEEPLRDQIEKGGFAIALSGGGHRATLATLGALLAIVDRGLAPKIVQIASVSGGSITNAFIAQRVRLEELRHGELDTFARELARIVISEGVLSARWIIGMLVVAVATLASGIVGLNLIKFPTVLAVLCATALATVPLILSGLVVEWRLDQQYFRLPKPRAAGRARLSELRDRTIDHVFCMTDLVLGLPVYVSAYGPTMFRRLEAEYSSYAFAEDPAQLLEVDLSVAEVVRASAAFPGIPPRRFAIPVDPGARTKSDLPRVAFLADGGLWNNLGSQVLREDRFIGSLCQFDSGSPQRATAPEVLPLFLFNGSAPLRPARPGLFRMPGIAVLKSLLQTATILTANTVLPRIGAMRRGFERRSATNERPSGLDPANIIADLRPTNDLARDYYGGTWSKEGIERSDPAIKTWQNELASRAVLARENALSNPAEDWLGYFLATGPQPKGSFPVCGLANIADWNELRDNGDWQATVGLEGEDHLNVGTTLGRIDRGVARRLIGRGYVNAFLVSLFLAPLGVNDLSNLRGLRQRLDGIAGVESTSPTLPA